MNKTPVQLYLELMKKSLSFAIWPEPPLPLETFSYQLPWYKRLLVETAVRLSRLTPVQLVYSRNFSEKQRQEGAVWPGYADTMIGQKRLDNLQFCVETVLAEQIPGDLIETGVWRGGACIFMRAILAAHGDTARRVFVADSFAGLPQPDGEQFPADATDTHFTHPFLAVSRAQVAANFERYGLLDEQVVFLEGWFKDTLPDAPIDTVAVLRLDGDMYESTMDALTHLYPKLAPGGFCIVDDYSLANCRQAIADYRAQHQITAEIIPIDWTGSYWRKPLS